jgi:hypothetical protein
MDKKKFTAKIRGGKVYQILAKNEGEALRLLLTEYRINTLKLEYLTTEDVNPEFVIQVGCKDYTTTAPNALEALRAFALMGLNMSKAVNLRKKA